MLLIFHILTAVSGVVLSAITAVFPSKVRIVATLILSALTLFSGILLTIFDYSNLTRVCVSGTIYLTLVIYFITRINNHGLKVRDFFASSKSLSSASLKPRANSEWVREV